MHIPEYPILHEYPKFVKDIVDATYCDNIKALSEKHNRALELNEQEGYNPIFEVYTDEECYSDWIYAKTSFSYMRKPTKEELRPIDSINYRMIENYNKFIDENPTIAKALKMKRCERESTNNNTASK